jgi:hypothetical protein
MVTGGYTIRAPRVIEPTQLPVRTPVSQRHCRRDPDQLGEHATAAREVVADLDDAVK